jgi:hypothetical protein
MIKITDTEVFGWKAAIRGMRNPKDSWSLSDSKFNPLQLGEADLKLMKNLVKAGSDHAKFMRMIHVQYDVVAPVFWWAEKDTYKVATVRNSCSKMHKIHVHPFSISDFTHEGCSKIDYAYEALLQTINVCERLRQDFNRTQDKRYWRALIELLPEGYNMRATFDTNYATLRNMYHARKNHKLDEWRTFCKWIESLPHSDLITG